MLSVEKNSSLESTGGQSTKSFGVRCGRIMQGYGPVIYWETAEAYEASIEKNKKAKPDILAGTVIAKGSSEGQGTGLLLMRYEDEGQTYLTEEELTVTGSLLAQGAGGGLLHVTPEDEDAREAVTLKAETIRAGKAYDGSDKAEAKSPFMAAAEYRYVETEGSPIGTVETCLRDGTCPIFPFTDADPNGWYHDGVHYVLEQGIMNGTGDTTFAPNEPTTRAMIVTMLWRMEGEPNAPASAFTDLEKDSWYETAVNWAAANEIVTGYDEKTFGPSDRITREQLAAILFRYSKAESEDGAMGLAGYEDADRISDWARVPMLWAVTAGIINGKTGSTLAPKDNATRAEVATMLMRLKK